MGITRKQKVGEGMNFIGVGDRVDIRLELRISSISCRGSRKAVEFDVSGVEGKTSVFAVSGGPYVSIYDGIRLAAVARGLSSLGSAVIDYSATRNYDMEKVEGGSKEKT